MTIFLTQCACAARVQQYGSCPVCVCVCVCVCAFAPRTISTLTRGTNGIRATLIKHECGAPRCCTSLLSDKVGKHS